MNKKVDLLNQSLWLPKNAFWGRKELAVYRDPRIAAYRGNPLIEALPPIYSPEELELLLQVLPPVDPTEKTLPIYLRKHALQAALKLFVPLPCTKQLEEQFSLAIRGGYQHRNIAQARYWPETLNKVEGFPIDHSANGLYLPTAHHGYLMGVSGMGKTLNIHRILGELYSQVIIHSDYRGIKCSHMQLVWLKLECPADGSIKGLCVQFLHAVDYALGTEYAKTHLRNNPTVDELLPIIARVASLHTIGNLVIDELQHLRAAASGGKEKMLNFFVNLANIIGVPIFLVGTFAARHLFTGEFRQIRRIDGHGPNAWLPMQNDAAWHKFTRALWCYQFLDQPIEWTEEQAEVLRDVSQGIPDYARKVYFLAQVRGMMHGFKSLNKSLIKSVARDSLQLSAKILDAMRHNDWDELEQPEDLPPMDWDKLYERETKIEPISLSSGNGNGHVNNSSNGNGHASNGAESSTAAEGPEKPETNGKRKKKGAKLKDEKTIMGIIEAAKQKDRNTTSYTALKEAGIIQDFSAVINPYLGINNRNGNDGNRSNGATQ